VKKHETYWGCDEVHDISYLARIHVGNLLERTTRGEKRVEKKFAGKMTIFAADGSMHRNSCRKNDY